MKLPSAPTQITEDEAELGFRSMVIQGIVIEPASYLMARIPVPALVVVARILNDSEILLKMEDEYGCVQYTHQQFGCHQFEPEKDADWRQLTGPHSDAALFLVDYDFRIDVPKDGFRNLKFECRDA